MARKPTSKELDPEEAITLTAVQTRLTDPYIKLLDDLRRLEDDLPSRGEMMRRILMDHLDKLKAKKEGK